MELKTVFMILLAVVVVNALSGMGGVGHVMWVEFIVKGVILGGEHEALQGIMPPFPSTSAGNEPWDCLAIASLDRFSNADSYAELRSERIEVVNTIPFPVRRHSLGEQPCCTNGR